MGSRHDRSTDTGTHPDPSAMSLRLCELPSTVDSVVSLSSVQFEVIYAPLVGPTAVLLARAMARHLSDADGHATVDPIELAFEIGLRSNNKDPLGSRSQLVHALDRLAHDHIVRQMDQGVVGVRTRLPLLSARTTRRLPRSARAAHERVVHTVARPREARGPGNNS